MQNGHDVPFPMSIEDEAARLWLRSRILAMGYTVSAFAKQIDMSRQGLHDILRGATPLTRMLASKLNAVDPEFEIVRTWRIQRKEAPAKKRAAKKPAK